MRWNCYSECFGSETNSKVSLNFLDHNITRSRWDTGVRASAPCNLTMVMHREEKWKEQVEGSLKRIFQLCSVVKVHQTVSNLWGWTMPGIKNSSLTFRRISSMITPLKTNSHTSSNRFDGKSWTQISSTLSTHPSLYFLNLAAWYCSFCL